MRSSLIHATRAQQRAAAGVGLYAAKVSTSASQAAICREHCLPSAARSHAQRPTRPLHVPIKERNPSWADAALAPPGNLSGKPSKGLKKLRIHCPDDFRRAGLEETCRPGRWSVSATPPPPTHL